MKTRKVYVAAITGATALGVAAFVAINAAFAAAQLPSAEAVQAQRQPLAVFTTATPSATPSITPTATAVPIVTGTQTPVPTVVQTGTPTVTLVVSASRPALAISRFFTVPVSQVVELHAAGWGYGEIFKLYQLSVVSGKTVSEVKSLRDAGLGWGQVAKQLNVRPGNAGFNLGAAMSDRDVVARTQSTTGVPVISTNATSKPQGGKPDANKGNGNGSGGNGNNGNGNGSGGNSGNGGGLKDNGKGNKGK